MPKHQAKAKRLSHLDAQNHVHMVDVGDKAVTERSASAQAVIILPRTCIAVLAAGGATRKGNVFEVARLAGIMAAKRTSDLIPLCHQIPLTGVAVELVLTGKQLMITTSVRCLGQTGVEMEALTAAAIAALTVYDMLKAISHNLVIGPIELVTKDGGRSGRIDRRKKL
ncbi:MAG TPA: cyclic pyranopterin monophosphate synthase MoaC [Planctomycetota bacterium]|nr:cyclic pyranopterin monophosphate synthase MoaC [Planctomycetota bacterium]